MASVVRERGLVATMADGVRLVADAWHPSTGGPWPVLLQRLPYGRAVASSPVLPSPTELARHGYAVVVQDVRGRGDSEGRFAPFVDEGADGADTVEWAAGLPWSTGDVVTYGFSYQGLSQLYTAARKPPSLRAIAPMMCACEPYQSWTYDGGCLRLEFVATWSAQLAGQEPGAPLLSPDFGSLPVRAALGPEPPRWFAEWLAHPEDDDYWAARRPNLAAIDVPAFTVLGYFDDFAAGTARLIATLDAEAVCGPWVHMPWGTRLGDLELADASPASAIAAFLAFADRVLGRSSGRRAPSRYYSIGAGWRDAPSWPPPHRTLRLTATSSGGANSRHGDGRLVEGDAQPGPPDVLVAEPLVPYPGTSEPLADVAAAEDRRDVLCYTAAPQVSALEVAGAPEVEVVAASDGDTFDVVATVVLVTDDHRCRQLTSGARRVGHQRPGEPLKVRVALGPVGITAPAGSRWRLDLSASRFPVLDRNPQDRRSPVADTARAGHRVATIEVLAASVELPVVTDPVIPSTDRR
jgi:predicted acyl esterase